MVSVAAGAGAAAHPRVSGENPLEVAIRPGQYGSSPRERGKLGWSQVSHLHERLIPA